MGSVSTIALSAAALLCIAVSARLSSRLKSVEGRESKAAVTLAKATIDVRDLQRLVLLHVSAFDAQKKRIDAIDELHGMSADGFAFPVFMPQRTMPAPGTARKEPEFDADAEIAKWVRDNLDESRHDAPPDPEADALVRRMFTE